MKTELKDLSEIRKELKIEIPAAAVDAEVEQRSRTYQKSARLPGFRPGKAPLKLVRQRLLDQILQEVAENLIPKAVRSAIEEHGAEPIAMPSIRDVAIADGKPLTFTAMYERLPHIDPGEYRGLTLRRTPADIGDEAVDKALEEIRQRAARVEPVEGRSIAQGDIVTVDLDRRPLPAETESESDSDAGNATIAPPAEADHHEGVDIEIGGTTNPPGFDEQLVGLDIDVTREFTLRYPSDHETPALAGTAVAYTATIKAIKERVVPPLNDGFAQSLGTFDNLESLTSEVRTDLERQSAADADSRMRSDLMKQLATRLDGEVPEALITQEIDRRVEHFAGQLASQGVDPRQARVDWDAFRTEQREPAIAMVRSTLVLDEISKKESIVPDPSEVDQELERQAARVGKTVPATRALLAQDGGLERLAHGLQREKAIDFLVGEATILNV